MRERAEVRAPEAAPANVSLPGSKASTVHANLFDAAFSCLTRARTPFSAFFHSQFLQSTFTEEVPQGQVWPMSLPYPEVHTKRRARMKSEADFKIGVNFVVMALNWLAADGTVKQKKRLKLGAKLSSAQWEAVRRLQPLISDWLSCGDVSPEDMGRSAARVESIEAVLMRLEAAAADVASELRHYGKRRCEVEEPAEDEHHEGLRPKVIGQLAGSVEHVAKDVEPSRFKFVGVPEFDPVPFLDYANRKQYLQPLDSCVVDDPESLQLPHVKVRCSRAKQLELVEKLDEVERLALVPGRVVRKQLLNGMFCLPKDQLRDRLILDARRPNAVEESEKRWIYSLGSAGQLLHMHLEPHEDLVLHAEDLREYYHCFVVPEQRKIRNALCMSFAPNQVRHLKCFKGEFEKETELFACLNTLAMGDTNAVAYGQVAHLSVILRSGQFKLADFLTLKQRPGRQPVSCGLMIDDFVIFEKVHRGFELLADGGEVKTDGRRRMEEVRKTYAAARLPRHEGKAVEQAYAGEFWGMQVDGRAGRARPNLKRLVPLAWIMLKVVEVGLISGGLLEILAGALVSAFQCRRRLMCCLEEIYTQQRGVGTKQVIKLSTRLKDELLVCIGMLPLAVIDLRLEPSDLLICSDASSTAEAAVAADIGCSRTQEFQRYGLQKGLWNRLLRPAAAYQRETDCLASEDELPDTASYKMNPLWEACVRGTQFHQFGSVKKSKGRSHINVKEMSAALNAERRLGAAQPNKYYIHLQDSQVSLAALIKGRSSSTALNRLLRKSVPHHVSSNVRAFYGYVCSALNPADDPTRKQPIRTPSASLPTWWDEVSMKVFEEFDKFLEQHGVHAAQLAELPDEEELLEDLPLDWRNSKEVKRDRGLQLKGCSKEVLNPPARLPHSLSPQDPAPSSSTSERAACASCSTAHGTGLGGAGTLAPAHQGRKRETAAAPESEAEHNSDWQGKAEKILASFAPSQFVFDRNRFSSLAEAVHHGPGLLDCFSGARGFARALVGLGLPWALCFDLKHSQREDLSDPALQSVLFSGIVARWFRAMAASPVCASFSTAITLPWRDREHPAGKPDLTETQQLKVEAGHAQLRFVLELCELCIEHGVLFWVENPDQSWFWKQSCRMSWSRVLGLKAGKVGDFRVDQCRFGTAWRKRTRFRTSCHLAGQKILCQCTKKHIVLRGRCVEKGMNYTKLAEAYPRRLCSYLAGAFAVDLGLKGARRKLDITGCAKCLGARIGEAVHPGPRLARPRPNSDIYSFHLLEPATVAMRAKLWERFVRWVDLKFSEGLIEKLVHHPAFLVMALEAFGAESFSTGLPLLYFRQLLAHVQNEIPASRPHMSRAWSLVGRWEIAEPTQHRTPLPEPVLLAMAGLGLFWGWERFTCSMLLCFYGICRIGEVLGAQREDLLTPLDLLEEHDKVVYLKIKRPKSRGRGPSVQYATCREALVAEFFCAVWQKLEAKDLLYGNSASAFRRRWDKILAALGIEKHHRLTPGSLRGGGAVAAHKRGVGIQDILWKMRLQHQRTLSFYLQESTAASILPSLSSTTREKVKLFRDALPFLLQGKLEAHSQTL